MKNIEKQRQYVKNHYNKNKQYYKDKAKRYRQKRKQEFFNYIQTLSCSVCKESDWRCLEFDHITPSQKKGNVSTLSSTGSYKKLKEELSKCRVLCANCHRKHTADQQGWYKEFIRGSESV